MYMSLLHESNRCTQDPRVIEVHWLHSLETLKFVPVAACKFCPNLPFFSLFRRARTADATVLACCPLGGPGISWCVLCWRSSNAPESRPIGSYCAELRRAENRLDNCDRMSTQPFSCDSSKMLISFLKGPQHSRTAVPGRISLEREVMKLCIALTNGWSPCASSIGGLGSCR
jgi:hypothetical protein